MKKNLSNLRVAGGFNTPLRQLFLLEERVRRMGATLPEDVDQPRRFHGIKCIISGTRCLIDIRNVMEVIEDRQITPVPGSVLWVEGVMNYRGSLLPVYSTHRFLMPVDTADLTLVGKDGPLLVLRIGNEMCAVRVNQVVGLQKCMDDDFYQSRNTITTPDAITYFIDFSIDFEANDWGRIDVTNLFDVITQQNPEIKTSSILNE